nr:olfactory receptor 6 [Tropidothorax elegans]
MHARMKNERTKFLKDLMIFGGLWLNFSGHKFGFLLYLFQISKLLYFIVGWIFTLNVLLNEGVKFLLTPSAVFIPLGINVITTSIIILLRMDKLEMLIETSDMDLSSYQEPWEKDIINSDTKKVIYLGNLFKYAIGSFTIIYIAFPMIFDFLRASFGYSEPYMVPLPLDGYFEENKSRNFNFYTVVLASDVWFLFGIPNTIAFQCNLFFVVSYATTQIKIVREHLKRLVNSADHSLSVLPDWKLRDIVIRHQQIIRLNALQRDCIPLPYLVQGLVSTVSYCFIMFTIDVSFGSDNLLVVLALMFMLIMLGIMFIMCYTGDFLEEEGNQLFYCICHLPWNRQSPKTRKILLTIICQAKRRLGLDYNRSSSLNLRTFMQMVNNAFSYFMILKSLEQ